MTIKFAKAAASDEGRSAVFAGNETRAAAEAYTARWFFRKRTLCIVGLVAGFLAINALSGAYVDFDFMEAAADIPGGLAWMAVNFLPSAASLEKLPQIMPALLSTVLDSIAASTTAALLAYVVAVLGSRSVGLGGVAQVLARGIASLFRNIPVVAWTFILLFSFPSKRVHRLSGAVPRQLRLPDPLLFGKHRRNKLGYHRGASGHGRELFAGCGAGSNSPFGHFSSELDAVHGGDQHS